MTGVGDPAHDERTPEWVVAVLAVVTTVVLASALAGPWHPHLRDHAPAPKIRQNAPDVPTTTPAGKGGGFAPPSWIVEVLGLLMGLLVLSVIGAALYLLLRWLLLRVGAVGPGGDTGSGLEAGEDIDGFDLPDVSEALAAATRAFDGARHPRDSVVRAWVALERAAAGSGIKRPRSSTPSEFTAELLDRSGCDEQAVATLLALYLRARFSEHPVTDADVIAASEALRACRESADGVRLRRVGEPTSGSGERHAWTP